MPISRRSFLAGTMACSLSALSNGPATAATPPAALTAQPGRARLVPDGYPETEIWGYDGLLPGPALRLRQGDRLERRFVNNLPQASTVHWHGIRIDNAMDGVPGLTQPLVQPGSEFDYGFTLPDAGTYWYHPHNKTYEQMARGLYGALIVEEASPPEVDGDEILLIDDWRLTEKAEIAGNFGALHDRAHGGRIGNWVTVNGNGAWMRTVAQHDRLRLRLVNTANARIFSLSLQGGDAWVIALDGQPLAQPQKADQFPLAPAQRVDLLVDVTAEEDQEMLLLSRERDGGYVIAAFPVEGMRRDSMLPAPAALPANPLQPIATGSAMRSVALTMSGGAMGGPFTASYGGTDMDARQLAAQGRTWAFNGMADMPEAPLVGAQRGESIAIDISNDTAWPHAMHLHGHHFRKLDADGGIGPWRDTLLMQSREKARIAFVADNPGRWLFHCHMLEHAAAGMMTWIEVA